LIYALQLKCPSCSKYLLDHSNTQLKRCELVLRIVSYDKNRTISLDLTNVKSLDDTSSKELRKE